MSFTAITKPSQGDTTQKALADAIIDNLNFLNSQLSTINSIGVPNASFEVDGDADGTPDEWTETLYTGGSFAITGNGKADTTVNHGSYAIKFTSPGGGGNGGGYIETDNFLPVTPGRALSLTWQLKSSVANIRNKVDVRWFDANLTYISTSTIYSSITNPTSWTLFHGASLPPSTARFAKIRLIGAEDSTTVAGSCYYDDVRVGIHDPRNRIELNPVTDNTNGAVFLVPSGVYLIEVECFGAGGAGANGISGSSTDGGGGGGGAYAIKAYNTTPGTTYIFTLRTGAASVFDSVSAGVGANGSGSGGGAGGTASGGDVNTIGTAGSNGGAPAGVGGTGGYCPPVGTYGLGGTSGVNGTDGSGPGAGGGGGSRFSSTTGGTGGPGLIVIRY
jgi:hypothetical protein